MVDEVQASIEPAPLELELTPDECGIFSLRLAEVASGATVSYDNESKTAYVSHLFAEAAQKLQTDGYASTKDELKYYAAAVSRRKQTAGVVVDGLLVATDVDSQITLANAVVAVLLNSDYKLHWSGANGSFVELNASKIKAAAKAVADHIAAAVASEASVGSKIDNGTVTKSQDVDAAF